METEFEDAESLGYDLGDFDSLVDLPEVLQAYYEAPDSFPSGEVAEALQRQQSQQQQQDPAADGAAHGGAGNAAEGAEAAVTEADGTAAGERSAGGTPHSHVLQDDNITDQLDKVDFGDFNFDLRLRMTFKKRWGPQHILLKDKLSFLLGSTLLWVCAFWLGHSPETFYRLYTVVGLALYVIRFFTYRRRDLHYYLFDFCYWANLLLMLHLWLWPNSELLQQTTFAFNTGPLTWTILAFRNSLVFHDLDKVTSVYLHLGPAFVSWSYHWYPEGEHVCRIADTCGRYDWRAPWKLLGLVVMPMLFYICWAILYYLKIFVFSAKKIQQRGYQTLFNYCTTQKRGPFHEISKRVPKRYQPLAYVAMHLAFCFCTLLIAAPCWYLQLMHTTLLVGVTTASIWAGASYYFEVFARRYHASIAEAFKGVNPKMSTDAHALTG